MSDDTENNIDNNSADAEPNEAPAGDTVDPVAALQEDNARLKDQLLRALAEMENLRKRTGKELRDARDYAVSSFARDMLTVGDNLRRALDAVDDDARQAADAALSGLLEGVEMTEREMLKLMEKHGVKKLTPEGERFDPNLHQAMFEVPNTEVPNGTVVQVVQAGYVIGDRMLRPAMVGVSKGGPKVAKPAPEAAPAESSADNADHDDPTVPRPGSTVDKTA